MKYKDPTGPGSFIGRGSTYAHKHQASEIRTAEEAEQKEVSAEAGQCMAVYRASLLPKRQDDNMQKKAGDEEDVTDEDNNTLREALYKSYEAKSN